jgi:acetate kinase
MTPPRVLVLNGGSSTLKWTLFAAKATRSAGTEEWSAVALDRRGERVRALLGRVGDFDAVGHRVVHGGGRFSAAVLLDDKTRAALEPIAALDPLHLRPQLAAIDAVRAACPSAPQVAAFDTAFHARLPEPAAGYPLPFQWTERWRLRRFGFHGLSVEHSVTAARRLLGRAPRRLIVCHLGSGCSITAVARGRSIDTTMGFSPLDGVMMATRCGSLDPGLVLHLQRACGLDVDTLADAFAHRSGLLGVSGISGDLREVLASRAPRARLAYQRFVWTLRRAVGAMAAVLGGADALVFTGGIGEHSGRVRRDVARALDFAGLRLSDRGGDEDRVISARGSAIAVLVIRAREDLVILGEVRRLLRARASRTR